MYAPSEINSSQTPENSFKDHKKNSLNPTEVLPKNRNFITPTNSAIPLSKNVNIITLLEYELKTVRKVPSNYIKNLLEKI